MVRRSILLSVLAVIFFATQATAQTTNSQVYSLFIMNIAKYSAWPEAATEFRITVLGKSKVYDELLKYKERGVNGLKISLLQVDNVNQIGQPQIVFLSENKSTQLDELLSATAGKPVMILTEREGLHKKGAAFSFFINDTQNVRYDINNTELEKRRVKVAKNLISMAHEVL